MVRLDEEMTAKTIEKYLKKEDKNIFIQEGENPPDFYVIKKENKIPLEITRAESIMIENNEVVDRTKYEYPLMDLCDELDKEFKTMIPNDTTYALHLKGPIENYSKFKKNLRDLINNIVTEVIVLDYEGNKNEFNLYGEKVRVNKIHNNGKNKKIIGFIGVKFEKGIYDIENHVELILDKIIQKKEAKIKEYDGEKWLGIYNNFFFDDPENFQVAIRNIKTKHNFTKIFMVFGKDNVVEIL